MGVQRGHIAAPMGAIAQRVRRLLRDATVGGDQTPGRQTSSGSQRGSEALEAPRISLQGDNPVDDAR
jgi:hypothetical protein